MDGDGRSLARSPDDDGHNVQCCGTSFSSRSLRTPKFEIEHRGARERAGAWRSEIENASTVSEERERGVSAVITRSI